MFVLSAQADHGAHTGDSLLPEVTQQTLTKTVSCMSLLIPTSTSTDISFRAKHRPDTLPLSTTNGEHCTGDGLKMLMKIGGRPIDLEKVQVHPTGLIDPKEPDSKVKFLAAEALRGAGGQ